MARSSERDLTTAVCEAPDSLELRSVLADLYLDRGDPRGRFIRSQLERAALPNRWDPRHRSRQDEEHALLVQHERAWVGDHRDVLRGWRFRRGLMEVVQLELEGWLRHGARLRRELPIRQLCLVGILESQDLVRLADDPSLAGIDTVELFIRPPSAASADAMGAALRRCARACRELRLHGFHDPGEVDIGLLLAAEPDVRLRGLVLDGCRLRAEGLRALSDTGWLDSLQRLRIAFCFDAPWDATPVRAATRLRSLCLGPGVAEGIDLALEHLDELRELALRLSHGALPGWTPAWDQVAKLVRLDLDAPLYARLPASPPELRCLAIDGLEHELPRALTSLPSTLTSLSVCNASGNQVTWQERPGLTALLGALARLGQAELPDLQVLRLEGTPITPEVVSGFRCARWPLRSVELHCESRGPVLAELLACPAMAGARALVHGICTAPDAWPCAADEEVPHLVGGPTASRLVELDLKRVVLSPEVAAVLAAAELPALRRLHLGISDMVGGDSLDDVLVHLRPERTLDDLSRVAWLSQLTMLALHGWLSECPCESLRRRTRCINAGVLDFHAYESPTPVLPSEDFAHLWPDRYGA